MSKTKIKSIVRLIVMVVLIINSGLALAGKTPLPINETTFADNLYTVLSIISMFASSFWSWWKDAPMTEKAQEANEYFKALKEDGDGSDFSVDGEIEGIDYDEDTEE